MTFRLCLVGVLSWSLGIATVLMAQDQEVKKQGKLSVREEVYRSVLCPPDWKATITQEYLDRDKRDEIKKRTWVKHCI